MNFTDINPYIRHADKLDSYNYTDKGTVASYDHVLIYIIDGNIQLSLNNRDYQLSRGCIAIIKPGSFFRIFSGNNFEFIIIHFDYCKTKSSSKLPYTEPQPDTRFDRFKIIDSYFEDDEQCFNTDYVAEGFNRTSKNILRIWSDFSEKTKHCEMRMKCDFTIALIDISQNVKTLHSLTNKYKHVGDKVLDYIHKNYNQNITLDIISENLNFHKSYINVLIKKLTGYSVHKYITIRRISKAVELLQYSEFPISEIAEIVGIPDISHFSKSFSRIMGKSPRQFRNSNK